MSNSEWIDQFKGLSTLPENVKRYLVDESKVMRVPPGTAVFGPGAVPDNLLFLLNGRVRVQQTSESGRDIVLYRVEAGESCVLTTACLLAHEPYSAEGITETEVTAVAIPRGAFDRLMASSREFRDFVLTAYARRITDLFRVIDDVAFGRIDVRLASRLISLAPREDDLATTHQQLATELGTAREVISRVLNDFQKRGFIAQSRGKITLLDRASLSRLAESA
ncbi:Crp/Fnr family transcriptional regulator [Marivita geojedonensis]|uniref:Crp/Fnr family transcriptional regulator n=1 Tax=Marivita geojedonensis TaxID=1123756 RepID=A0A1X4NHM0_9RHOB|nr:Crp/Fnr family transcriptional regulator [Marivita geojedonensis]OSQ47289.1 Crp/Fnr family transcriptional regulator [Marivita geojedonensis]PRY76463.1 CRP/FNR family transcriptional regulator [Marivita geojedonensis]